jgi:16S rRNA G1207 methylase RsmC
MPKACRPPTADLRVNVDELTADARRTALAWMSARHAALADIDALHALQPALRAISRARNPHQERDVLDTVTATIQRHRARAHQELAQLLDNLRDAQQVSVLTQC